MKRKGMDSSPGPEGQSPKEKDPKVPKQKSATSKDGKSSPKPQQIGNCKCSSCLKTVNEMGVAKWACRKIVKKNGKEEVQAVGDAC